RTPRWTSRGSSGPGTPGTAATWPRDTSADPARAGNWPPGSGRLGSGAAGQVVQRLGGTERGVDREQPGLLLSLDHGLDVLDRRGERVLIRPGAGLDVRLAPLDADLEPVLRGGVERVGEIDLPGGPQQAAERLPGQGEATRQQQPAAAGEAEAAPQGGVHAAGVILRGGPGAGALGGEQVAGEADRVAADVVERAAGQVRRHPDVALRVGHEGMEVR